jgi:hypothetical protein
MVSKTSMLPLVRAFDWKAVDAGLREKPQLVEHRDAKCHHKRSLYRRVLLVLGTHVWAHSWAPWNRRRSMAD